MFSNHCTWTIIVLTIVTLLGLQVVHAEELSPGKASLDKGYKLDLNRDYGAVSQPLQKPSSLIQYYPSDEWCPG